MGIRRDSFVRKPTSNGFIYRWKPEDELKKKVRKNPPPKVGCDATPSSQGEDYIVTFVYETVNNNGVLSRIAYVACDYVE